ncbi:MAG: hypothetical protein A3E83_07970 [Gammaproteobacteria bacterium RIFCSPHIGHO2_12_FULL_41_20]|nr:MAG: hypothetical protein A3E83_07970 [Gammaproteobacteria bacterium RIFCSPHIGHO2_12_FULL_41_20]
MAHTYRTIHHWDQWLEHFLGRNLLEAEQHLLKNSLPKYFGKHILLVGVPKQYSLLQSSVMPYQCLVTPLPTKIKYPHYIEGNFHELPIHSGSVDLVVLPHTLEYVDNPQHVLTEACRVVKPEGCILILGFNPYGLWGLRKVFSRKKITPWSNNFIQANTIKKWLLLSDFEMVNQLNCLYRFPIQNQKLYKKTQFLEGLGRVCPFLGSVYMVVAKAKVIPLTPIRLRWQQQLSGIRISTTMTGRIVRNAK